VTAAWVVVPTYEEAENIERLLREIRTEAPDVDVLVVDDNSSDGTADLADAAGRALGHITVLRRGHKSGLGSAYRDGFAVGIARGYETLVEMDADLSHDPASLRALLREVDLGADLAIGSRYVLAGRSRAGRARRRALSRFGNAYSAWVLAVRASDLTSGYRAFRAATFASCEVHRDEGHGLCLPDRAAHRVARDGGTMH